MKEISELSNHNRIDKPGYICGETEFVQETDAKDGTQLVIIDEVAHKISRTAIAYNGYWND